MSTSPTNTNPAGSQAEKADDAVQPILTHEKSLYNKIAKGSEAGDILDQQMVMLGIQLITQLNVLLKTSRIHGRTNAALDKPVDAMLTLIKTLAHDQPITLRLQNDFLFLGNQHLKINSQQMAIATSIIDALHSWKIGGVAFASSTASKDLREFAYLFVSLDPATKTLDDFRSEMNTREVSGITLEEPRELIFRRATSPGTASAPDDKLKRKATAKQGYTSAVQSVGNLMQSTREGGSVSFKQAKRAIQNIVDLMMQDQSTLLGLTNLRCHDQYTHNHSVNVALLSMALGNRAGYPKVHLADLGLAALFHDVGKCAISLDVLNKPGEFTKEEWDLMRTHPTEGVLTLIRLRGLDNVPARMAAASFEHHMNYDFSGYPKLTLPWTQSLASRIVTIADCYDAMTSSRVYRREPMSPANVLKIMFAKSGQSFDPILMKLFVNCVGFIPIGSLVMLDTDELAVVLKPAEDKANAERPLVKVIADSQGAAIDNGPEFDLTEKDKAGNYQRSIIRLIDNTKHKFDTGRYFV
ncbi:MAG TPA: HD-GYP domain-containing protein [Nitrospiraceae bacterium]|nr:HD-GYP domain-containing protein [Nitrospiraceae bacterium]